jgi:integrase
MKIKMTKDNRNKDSPWIVRWSNGPDVVTGREKWFQRSFKYKALAEKFKSELRTGIAEEARKPNVMGDMSLKGFTQDWLRTRKHSLRAGSVDVYRNAIRRLLDYFGGSKRVTELTPIQANRFIAEQARIDGRIGQLSNWSRARILRNCKTMFNDAVDWGLVVESPFGRLKRPKLPKQRWHYVRPQEFRSLLDAHSGKHTVSLRYKALYSLAYCCGLRLGEIVNLMWEDVDFEKAEVRVEDRPATHTRPPFVVKDKEARRIGIPEEALSLLLDLKAYNDLTDQTTYVALTEAQHKTAVKKWQRYQEEKREWKSRDMQNNTLTTFKRHAVWAGIKPTGSLSIHGLRKSCITNWANEINNPEVVRYLAGHSDIKTTMQYYSAVTQEQREKAARAIDGLLRAEKGSAERYV